MAKRFLVLIALLTLGFYVAGCSEGDDSTNVTNPNADAFKPVGSISGVVFDTCLSAPISGALVSVAYSGSVHQVRTADNGGFSFKNVPANEVLGESFDVGDPAHGDDAYHVVCDLTDKTGYGYAMIEEVEVIAGDLNDGDNAALEEEGLEEGGAGADTPVDGLNVSCEFMLAQPNASISGTIYDVTTGRVGTAASVALANSNGVILQTTTASAAGVYTFDNVIPGQSYYLLVTKAGYCYADDDFQTDGQEASCNMFDLDCTPACAQDLAGVDVNIWYDPTKDVTIPYIASVDADDETDLVHGDDIDFQIDEFVVTFSEAMRDDRTVRDAITLSSDFTVSVESDGGNADSSDYGDIVADWTAVMDSSGVLTIALEYVDEADIIEYAADDLGWDEDATEITGYAGSYTLGFVEGSIHLTDLALIPWAAQEYGDFYLSPLGSAYQNNFILGGITVGIGTETMTIDAEF